MATLSDFLGMQLDSPDDFYNIKTFNDNYTKIEAFLKRMATADLMALAAAKGYAYEAKKTSADPVTWQETIQDSTADIKLTKTSTKTEAGWTVVVDGFGLSYTVRYTKSDVGAWKMTSEG